MANPLIEKNATPDAQNDFEFETLVEQKRYQILKTLLLQEETQRLQQLESCFDNPNTLAEKIAPVLPNALQQGDKNALHKALSDIIQTCITEFMQTNLNSYAEVLYPIIFPAIKKSIAETFKETMQSLNQTIAQGLSLNRLAWHFESWRTGLPYREIVLRHTLAYRVEQVFLIHRETGLLLHHVSQEGIDTLRDSDAVSAMLTAIQDFIKDSFSVHTDDYLDKVEIGNYTVFLNRGSHAVLACVIKGMAPYSLQEKFDDTLNEIHRQYGFLLKNFAGDSEPLAVTEPLLKTCLLAERKQKVTSSVSQKYILIPIALLCVALGYWLYNTWQFEHRADNYLQQLQQNQSIVITQQNYQHGRLNIQGLYDPLSEHPDALIEKSTLHKNEVRSHWQAYQSLAPAFVEQRLKQILQPPANVQWHIENNRLIITGLADIAWINKLSLMTPSLVGINGINTDQLQSYQHLIEQQLQPPNTVQFNFENGQLYLQGTAPFEWYKTVAEKIAALNFVTASHFDKLTIIEEQQLQALNDYIKNAVFYFKTYTNLTKEQVQDMDQLAASFKQIQQLGQQLNKPTRLLITGYTDGLGLLGYNTVLAHQRVDVVLAWLKQHDITLELELAIKPKQSIGLDRLKRKVSFEVLINQGKKE